MSPNNRNRRATAQAAALSHDRVRQTALIAMGWTIIAVGVLIAPLPGPLGLPVVLMGAAILLRNSVDARRGFVRLKRRYPALFGYIDRFLRNKAP